MPSEKRPVFVDPRHLQDRSKPGCPQFLLQPPEEIREHLRYDEDTGQFWWIKRARRRVLSRPAGARSHGYISIRFEGRGYLGHRLAWWFVHGFVPPCEIDHINRDRSDNRIANLRTATRQQNSANASLAANNTSGHRGVSLNKKSGLWVAMIRVDGKQINLGEYPTRQEAAAVYRGASKIAWGAYAA